MIYLAPPLFCGYMPGFTPSMKELMLKYWSICAVLIRSWQDGPEDSKVRHFLIRKNKNEFKLRLSVD